jgi:spore coat protein H
MGHTLRQWHALVALILVSAGGAGCGFRFTEAPAERLAAAPATRPSEAPPRTAESETPPSPLELTQVAHAPPPDQKRQDAEASNAFFDQGMIPQIKIQLSQQEEQKLRADQRRFVDCTLIENGQTTYKKVAVKLKGAAGSFRNLDDKPAFTLKLKKKGERFHGLDKFHLNNSVQDESYLCELLGSQLFREARYPAARVTHARVWLNDRDLGFYVLKEGLDEPFLERNFGEAKGNLYDGGFCVDIDANLEKDAGDGPDDLSDLKALVNACREGDEAKRHQFIAEQLDVDAFLTYTALELMTCHWDGYLQNRNNYRVYFRGNDKRAQFIPHGMDQIFQDPNFSCFHDPGPIVANPVFRNLEWKAKYRRRVKELLPLFEAEKLHAKIDAAHARIRPVVASIHEDRARHLDDRVKDLKNRVADRAKNIRQQMANLPPEPLLFDEGKTIALDEWLPKQEADAKLEERDVDGQPSYVIEVGPSNRTTASWRRKVLLVRGKYQLDADAKVTNVTAIGGDPQVGLGLRISGGQRQNNLVGSTGWQKVSLPIEITDQAREVELVAELRSTSGSGAFKKSGLRITKLE